MAEIDRAVHVLTVSGCDQIVLLHCILNYPTDNSNAHLRMLKVFSVHILFPLGYSDHTLPDPSMTSLTTAYLLGAVVIEKHFTYDKSLSGNDHYHAMDVVDLFTFVQRVRLIHELMGPLEFKQPLVSEQLSRKNARRSIVIAHDLPSGHTLSSADLICKRPGTGITADHWDDVIGRNICHSLDADHILLWQDLCEDHK